MVSRESLRFSWFAAACISLYGFASWIVVNGVWVELPVLVKYLPEGWSLPAYLSVVIQIANLGPLLYLPLTKLCRRVTRSGFGWRCLQPPERLANYIILSVGLLSCILMAHLWDRTVQFTKDKTSTHSVGLLSLAFFASIVDCTSSITFAAYLTGLPETYMGALQFGEGFSDLIPSTLALIQGVGESPECVNQTVNGTTSIVPIYPPPRFSVTVFMYCMASLLVIALVAFSLLDLSPYGVGEAVWDRYMANVWSEGPATKADNSAPSQDVLYPNSSSDESASKGLAEVPAVTFRTEETTVPIVYTSPSKRLGIRLLTSEYLLPIGLLAYLSFFTFGFLPGLQTYSSSSYNDLTYHLAVTISGVVGAIVTVGATYFVHRNRLKQSVLTAALYSSSSSSPDVSVNSHDVNWATPSHVRRVQLIWIILAFVASIPTAYVIYLSCRSPNPPQLGGFGPALAIISWVLLRAVCVILRTWLWLHLSSRSHEPAALRYAGLATQIGAALGAILNFLLVVQFQLFMIKLPCSG